MGNGLLVASTLSLYLVALFVKDGKCQKFPLGDVGAGDGQPHLEFRVKLTDVHDERPGELEFSVFDQLSQIAPEAALGGLCYSGFWSRMTSTTTTSLWMIGTGEPGA